jgi:hypothetical protein
VIDPSEIPVAQMRIRRKVDHPVISLLSFRVARETIIKVPQYEMEIPIVGGQIKGFLLQAFGLGPVASGLFYVGEPAIGSGIERVENQRLIQLGSGQR